MSAWAGMWGVVWQEEESGGCDDESSREHPPVVEDAMYLQPLGTNSIPV